MAVTLYLCRHGNTFTAQDTPVFIGAATDLPLTRTGEEQAENLADWFRQRQIQPDSIYTSALQRAGRYGTILSDRLGTPPPEVTSSLNEIAFGDWEGKTSDALEQQYGSAYLAWQKHGDYPHNAGWAECEDQLKQRAASFVQKVRDKGAKHVIAVTSNGIARYILRLNMDAFATYRREQKLKMPTGGVSCLQFTDDTSPPKVLFWGEKP